MIVLTARMADGPAIAVRCAFTVHGHAKPNNGGKANTTVQAHTAYTTR